MPQETDFVMGTEEECLTVAGNNGWAAAQKIFVRFMRAMADLAPALPSQNGMFNGYGKILVDTGGHIELSSAECDSPYLLAEIVDRQHQLAGQALARLEQAGAPLVLANNNHSELLTRRSNTWGSHESYLTGIAPQAFTGLILPFLVTRIYAGAGGILYPCGSFVASVRALRMNLATGGDTTGHRAIHSTARDESLMGGPRRRHRYHLISGDGHRSQFNLALQFGATALALKAIEMNDGLGASLAGLALPRRGSWPGTMRALNVLSRRGEPLRVDPLVTATQRLYLEAARRYRAALSAAPAWIDRTLRDWEDTLAALERADWPWLAARLDAFAKHALWSGVLAARGKTWESLAHDRDLLQRLALLDQSYHEFGSASSVFARLEEAGLLEHRVAAPVAPGEEEEPFVPATATRARVRARFIRENAGQEGFHVDWCAVYDVPRNRRIDLSDPFAPALGEWAEAAVRTATPRDPLLELRRRLNEDVRTAYEQGRVRQVLELLPALQEVSSLTDSDDREVIYKHRAWTTTQAGYLEGDRWLMHAYAGDVSGFEACVDHVAVRTIALCPPPDTREWIERAFAALQAARAEGAPPEALRVARFLQIAGEAWLHAGGLEDARALLEEAACSLEMMHHHPRQRGKLLGTLGEAYRVFGDPRRARALLTEARELSERHGHLGLLADYTYPSLAKLEWRQESGLAWLEKAKALQVDQGNVIGLVRTLLLEARLTGPGQSAEANRVQVDALRRRRPALHRRRCPLLNRILARWRCWVSGGMPEGVTEDFWRL